MTQQGFFGEYGGQFIPETLKRGLAEIAETFYQLRDSDEFQKEFEQILSEYVGRPSPLTYVPAFSETVGGARVYLKREDLNHTGAHKINNTIGQALLAKRMGKKRIVAETGAGQHGVAAATAAALSDMDCIIYQGEEDMRRQNLNVHRMRLLGAEIIPVTTGRRTLKNAVDAALADYLDNVDSTYYMLGSAVGPHPYPTMVRHFQSVIGREARQQILDKEGRLPDYLVACVGGGSNAIGLFHSFIADEGVKLVGVEPAGRGLETGEHAASLTAGSPGILHGFKSLVLCDEEGEARPVYSIAAGLDYPAVGPEHCHLQETGRAKYTSVTDVQALDAFQSLCETEGIIPALESSHALAYVQKAAEEFGADDVVVVNLSGRGDKDVREVVRLTR